MTDSLQQFEGKYEILAKIGEGGMGAVYKVRHRLLDEVRVIKVMRPQVDDQSQVKNRFLREARIAVKVRHPNIAQMYDFSVDDAGTAFIVMEYIDGLTLQTALQRSGPPSVGLALEIAQQSLQALAHVHKKGIVHRDISPDNLMLTVDDLGEPRVKLIDLGIAKTVKGEHNLTATGVFLGKIRYASPEQFRPQEGAAVDHRADLYSFGVVLYELLTGQHPIKGDSWSQLIAGHLFEPPLSFDHSDPDHRIPGPLREVVTTALAKPPADRFQDAKAFRQALAPLVREHRVDPAEVATVVADRGEGHEEPVKPGSTQDRINRQFGDAQPGRRAFDEASVPTTATPTPGDTPDEGRLEALVSAAARLVDLELYTEARTQLEAALKVDPDHGRAHALLAKIEQAEKRAREVSEAVSRIERLIEAGQLEDAADHVRTAIGRVGEVTELAAVRERVEHLMGERRAAEVGRLLEAAADAESGGRHRDAVEALERAAELAPERSTVATRLEAARSEAARMERVDSLLDEAHVARSEGDHDRAMALLEQAAELAPDRSTVISRLEEARATADHERRVAAAVVAVERLVAAGRLADAESELQRVRGELGGDARLDALDGRVAELAVAQRQAAVAEAVVRGQRALDDGDLDAAARAFEGALQLDPDDDDGRRGIELVEGAKAERRAKQVRAAAVAEAEQAVRSALERGDLAAAAASLDEALETLGEASSLLELRGEIEAGRRAAEEQARREQERARRTAEQEQRRADAEQEKARRAAAEAPRRGETAAKREHRATTEDPGRQPARGATGPAVDASASPDLADGAATTVRIDIAERPPEAPATAVAPAGRSRIGLRLAIGVVALLIIAVGVTVIFRSGGELQRGAVGSESGTLVVAATPWGEVVEIVDADGTAQPLPDDLTTPVAVELPAGEYTVRVRGPDGGGPVDQTAVIVPGETVRTAPAFAGPSADELLARYGL